MEDLDALQSRSIHTSPNFQIFDTVSSRNGKLMDCSGSGVTSGAGFGAYILLIGIPDADIALGQRLLGGASQSTSSTL